MSRTGDKEARKVAEVLTVYKEHLESGKSARSVKMEEKERNMLQT